MNKKDTAYFINKAKTVHGDTYDYSISDYKAHQKKIKIICKKHGIFEQTPGNHYSGKGCPNCGLQKKIKSHNSVFNYNIFINKVKSIYGDKYDYSSVKVVYKRAPISIICKKHGPFNVSAYCHLFKNHECPECEREIGFIRKRHKNIENNFQHFLEKSFKIHGSKYDYSKVVYKKTREKVIIFCILCKKDFYQKPSSHLQGQGCPYCSINKRKINLAKTTNRFINEATLLFGAKYDYSKVKYINNVTKVILVCSDHGEFKCSPYYHLKGISGCPKCNRSLGEIAIENYLNKNNIDFKPEKKFNGCKNKILLRFDFYIYSHNLCIEFDGPQHFKPYGFGSMKGDEKFKVTKINDKIKNSFCKKHSINLLRIHYNKLRKIDKILDKYFKDNML